jgi:hypothetical protein
MLLESISSYNSHLSSLQNSFVTSITTSSLLLTSIRISALEFNLYLCYNKYGYPKD